MNNEVVSTLGNRAFAHPATAVAAAQDARPLIEIQDLNVQFVTSHGTVRAVEDLSYSVYPGEMVAIVGEVGLRQVGIGARHHAAAAAGHRPHPKGSVRFDGRELLHLSEEEMRRIRGREIAMIFQEPMTSLNPVLQIGLPDHRAAHHPSRHGRRGRRAPGQSSC